MVTLDQLGEESNIWAHINQLPCESNKCIGVKGVDEAALPNTFYLFFARFERPDSVSYAHQLMESLMPKNDIIITSDYVTTVFKETKIKKAAGPDRICGRTLHYCADQLGGIFSYLFQLCTDSCRLPTMWKKSTVIPLPKSKNPTELNDLGLLLLHS